MENDTAADADVKISLSNNGYNNDDDDGDDQDENSVSIPPPTPPLARKVQFGGPAMDDAPSTVPTKVQSSRKMRRMSRFLINEMENVWQYELSDSQTEQAMEIVRKHRNTSILWVFLVLLIIGITAVVYFFIYSMVNVARRPLPSGPFEFNVIMEFTNQWSDDLEITTSELYQSYNDAIISGFDMTFTSSESEFSEFYASARIHSFTLGSYTNNVQATVECFVNGAPPDISVQPDFSSRFIMEIQAGFESGNFVALNLQGGDPISIVGYKNTDLSDTAPTS